MLTCEGGEFWPSSGKAFPISTANVGTLVKLATEFNSLRTLGVVIDNTERAHPEISHTVNGFTVIDPTQAMACEKLRRMIDWLVTIRRLPLATQRRGSKVQKKVISVQSFAHQDSYRAHIEDPSSCTMRT